MMWDKTTIWLAVYGAIALAMLLIVIIAGCEQPSQLQPLDVAVEIQPIPEPPRPTPAKKPETTSASGSTTLAVPSPKPDAEVLKRLAMLEGAVKAIPMQARQAIDVVDERVGQQLKALADRLDKLTATVNGLRAVVDAAAKTEQKLDEIRLIVINLDKQLETLAGRLNESNSRIDLLQKAMEPPKPKEEESPPLPEPPKPKEPQKMGEGILPTETYGQALAQAKLDHRPIVILIGAEWCEPCKQVYDWLPQLRQHGHLAYVDVDKQNELARNAAGSGSVPRLAVYRWDGKQWLRRIFVGSDQIRQYAFSADAAKEPTANDPGTIPSGFTYPDALVLESDRNVAISRIAQGHADYQAKVGVQGHQGFDQRRMWLISTVGPGAYAEICAESWDRQANDSPEELWTEMFTSWRQSPGHWSVASRKHSEYGSGMAKSKRGIWYATIITRDVAEKNVKPAAADSPCASGSCPTSQGDRPRRSRR